MKNGLKSTLPKVESFWLMHRSNFYFGMVLCMMFIVNIPLFVQPVIGIAISPVLSVLTYLLIWLFNCRKKPEKMEVLKNAGMVLSGSLWTLLFAIL